MHRPKRDKNGKTGAGRISSVIVGVWLIFGWSRPAFPDEKPHLKLAPIEFMTHANGEIGYTYQRNTIDTIKTTQQLLDLGVYVGVQARSYLWQPWLARVIGSVGVSSSANTTRNTSNNVSEPATKSENSILTGDATILVLQYSRFPFKAHGYREDNQTSGFLSDINSDFLNKGYDLTQIYRSRDRRTDGLLSYIHNASGRISFGTENVRNQLNLTFNSEPLYTPQTFRVVSAITSSEKPLIGDHSLTDTVVANHLYRPTPDLSVGSLVNLIKTNDTTAPTVATGQYQRDFNSQQLSSIASWRPEGSPVTLITSARLLKINSIINGVSDPHVSDTNLNIGANYAWSRLLRMYGSVNVNDNNGIQIVTTNATLAAQKGFGVKDVGTLGGFRYTQSLGGSISTQTASTNSANQSTSTSLQRIGGNAGHDLSKATDLGGGRFIMNMNQVLSTVLSSNGSPYTHLTTGGSLSWNQTENKGSTTLRLSAADSRDLSSPQNYFQLISLQASRNEHLARNQSLIGNLTIDGSRSGGNDVEATPFAATPNADLNYHHQRLLGVKNMDFTSTLRIQGNNMMSSQNLTATQDQSSVSWDNTLNYFIGRLKMRFYTHMAKVDNIPQSSILFTVTRSF